MNFWLLVAIVVLLAVGWRGRLGLAGAGKLLDLAQAIGNEVADDVDEVLAHQPLRAANQQRCGVARFVALYPFAGALERADRVLARGDRARARSRRAVRLARFAGGRLVLARRPLPRLRDALHQLLQRR